MKVWSIDCLHVIPAACSLFLRKQESSVFVFRSLQALDDSLRSPLRGRPAGVLRALRLSGCRWDDEQNQKRSAAISLRFAVAVDVAVASGAHDARLLFRAPSAAVSRGRSGRAAGEATDGLAFSRGQESARKARPRLTHLPGRTPGKRRRGVAFSLGYFSLGHAREK
ncbi:MAG: hypothetical protein J0I96_05730 [Rhodanobacter sp.]|nr:hypothetical protein [Rhodanobacter sp.]